MDLSKTLDEGILSKVAWIVKEAVI